MIVEVEMHSGENHLLELKKIRKGWSQRIIGNLPEYSHLNVDYISHEKLKDLKEWWAIDFERAKIISFDDQ